MRNGHRSRPRRQQSQQGNERRKNMSANRLAPSSAKETSARHDTFVIERELAFSPAQVFAAWADPVAKARWFSGTAGQWKELVREADFRVGGRERVDGAWASGP